MIPDNITILDIRKATAAHFDLTEAELASPRRLRKLCVPRYIAYRLAKDVLGASIRSIGDAFGSRDHSTIIVGLRKLEELRDTDLDADLRIIKNNVLRGDMNARRYVEGWPFISRRKPLTGHFIRRHSA